MACALRFLHCSSQHNCLKVGTDLCFKGKATEWLVGSVTEVSPHNVSRAVTYLCPFWEVAFHIEYILLRNSSARL